MKFRHIHKVVLRSKNVKRLLAVVIFLQIFFVPEMNAQKHYQTWLEYIPTFSLPKSFSLELRGAYRTEFEDPRWHTYELRTQPEYKLNKYIKFLFALDLIRTHQNDHLTTFEVREALGVSFHFTPGKRIQTGMTIKGEQRNVQNLETEEWESSTRLRILGNIKSPLNKKSMTEEHVLYGMAELEFFIGPDEEITERYANKLRVYAGMGYKVIHNLKLELLYMWQESRNTIHGDVSSGQNIFRFRVLHSFGAKKKAK